MKMTLSIGVSPEVYAALRMRAAAEDRPVSRLADALLAKGLGVERIPRVARRSTAAEPTPVATPAVAEGG